MAAEKAFELAHEKDNVVLLSIQARTPSARSVKLGTAELKIKPSEKKEEQHLNDKEELNKILKYGIDLKKYAAFTGNCETRIEEGDARQVIVGQAQVLGADYIIMGSRGLGALSNIIVGSVSTYVLQHAPCPVMIVRETSKE